MCVYCCVRLFDPCTPHLLHWRAGRFGGFSHCLGPTFTVYFVNCCVYTYFILLTEEGGGERKRERHPSGMYPFPLDQHAIRIIIITYQHTVWFPLSFLLFLWSLDGGGIPLCSWSVCALISKSTWKHEFFSWAFQINSCPPFFACWKIEQKIVFKNKVCGNCQRVAQRNLELQRKVLLEVIPSTKRMKTTGKNMEETSFFGGFKPWLLLL